MKVTLNVENDKELRDYIKECINQQVLSIVRDEFLEIVKSEILRKIKSIGNRDFDYLQKTAFESAAKKIILPESGIFDWNDEFIKPLASIIVTDRIEKAVKGVDWKKIVDTLAKEKLKSLIS